MKMTATLALFVTTSLFAHVKSAPTVADNKASASYTEQRHHPWPFPLLSIGHNMQSYQNYGNSPYWHDGLDIRAAIDQPIYAAAGGKVVNIENYVEGNALYWEVAVVDEEGFVWKYHHVAEETITPAIRESYESGKKIDEGTHLGNVVRWPSVSYGEVYHHLHLLVVGKDGQYINPFLMMEPLADTKAPVIQRIGIAQNHRPLEASEVKGPHALFLEASDLTLHEKFLLPPHKISYRLDREEEKLVWEFIHLPSGTNDEDYISDFYMQGTCGNYVCRKFYFNLNFTKEAPRGTFTLSRGEHQVEVTVEDIVGNKTTQSYRWTVL